MQHRTRALTAVGALTLSLLSACGGEESSADGDTIRIASIAPMSGPASVYGNSVTAAMKYAIDERNEAGGVTVDGQEYQIEMTLLDDEQTPEVAQTEARRALDDGYDFLFGPFGSGTASAAQSIMAQSDAYWQLLVAIVEGPTQNPNVFRSGARVGTYTDIAVDYLEKHPEVQRVAMITDQQHTGLVGEEEALVSRIEELGREVVLQQRMQLGDTDFRAPLTQMLDVDPDLYMMRAYPSETALMTKQLAELGGDVPVQWSAGMTTGEATTLVGDEDAMARVTQATPLANLDPWVAAEDPVALDLQEALGDGSGAFAVAAYDGMQIFFEGLENAEAVTPEALQEALADLGVEDVADATIQDFQAQEGDRLFQDREVRLIGQAVRWEPGTGFVLDDA